MRISDWSSDVCSSDLNAVFLKYSRDDEREADRLGAEIMANAGYDPLAMATFFELLKTEQGRNPSKLEQFSSSRSEERRVGKECVIRVDLGGLRIIKKKKKKNTYNQ